MYNPVQPQFYNYGRNCYETNLPPPGKFVPRECRRPPPYHRNTYENHNTNSVEYWCETCDRAFTTQYQLDNHKNQHEKCNIEGCQFVAHPKVITRHIQMQHSTGLYNKICKLQSPEDIKKWREERKKKYPTKINIDKKNAEIKEKIDRGEMMALNRNRNNYKSSKLSIGQKQEERKRFNNVHQNNKKNNRQNTNFKNRCKKSLDVVFSDSHNRGMLKPFSGILELSKNDDNSANEKVSESSLIEDDDWIDDRKNETKTKICGALSTLICDYGSSEEEGYNSNTIIKPEEIKVESNQRKINFVDVTKDIQEINVSDDSGPEEEKIRKEAIDNVYDKSTEKNLKEIVRKVKIEHHRKPNTMKNKLPSTLLQKLLYKEIRQERNIVLQCIRHIVKNNYFDNNGKNV